jgi:hypothetical protein
MEIFKINQTYSCNSVCDHNCEWSFLVARRTAKTVWLKDERGETKGFRIRVWNNAEQVNPFGSYSMAPILSA